MGTVSSSIGQSRLWHCGRTHCRMSTQEDNDTLVEGVMHVMRLMKRIEPPSKCTFLFVSLCGFCFVVLSFIALIKTTDGVSLALGSVALVLGSVQLIVSLNVMRKMNAPVQAVNTQVMRLRQILIEEKGLTAAQLDATSIDKSEATVEGEPPQMHEVSDWFERRDQLGETTQERREQARAEVVAQSQAIDAKRDREPASMERSEHDFDLEDPITAGGSAQKQRSRKSKNKSSRSKVMELENSINLSPLSPRHLRTQGKSKPSYEMNDLTPQQKQLVMAQMREKKEKERKERADTLIM